MNEVVLLGAGASKEAGVPTAIEMTRSMLELAGGSVDDWNPASAEHRILRLLRFVVGGLVFQQGISGADPLTTGINIEAVFNAISLLARRNTLEFSPFVASWHPVLDNLTRRRAHRLPFGDSRTEAALVSAVGDV